MIRLVFRWLLYRKKWFIFILAFHIINTIIEALLPLITSEFIDGVLLPKATYLISVYCFAFLIFIITEILLKYIVSLLFTKYQSTIVSAVIQKVIHHITRYPYSFFTHFEPGYLTERINHDINDLISFTLSACLNIVLGVGLLLGASVYILFIDKLYLLLFSLIVFGYIGIFFYLKKRLVALSLETREYESYFFNDILKIISNIKPIKIHNLYSIYENELHNKLSIWIHINVSREKLSYWFSSSREITNRIFMLINFSYGGYQVIDGSLTIGQFVAINTYFVLALSGISTFLNLAQQFQSANSAFLRIHELEKVKPEESGKEKFNLPLKSIKLDHISYVLQNRQIINNLSYDFKKGRLYCIIGHNGSGKTTLVNLIVGLLKPSQGNIFYNNIPLALYDKEDIYNKVIGFSDQEPFICENLIRSKKINTELMKQFSIDLKKINSMKQINIKLSGGEKQKIAHLEFLLSNKELIILDEPTSAMDQKDSIRFWQYIERIRSQKIIIVVTHQKNEINKADAIINLDRYSKE